MIKRQPHYLKLVTPGKPIPPRYSLPPCGNDWEMNDAAKGWLADQLIDGKDDDFVASREDFKELLGWSLVKWVRGKPYLTDTGLGSHRIRIPGTRLA